MRHIVHGKRRLIHAVLYALGENAGCSAVSDGKTVGEIGKGFLVLLGVGKEDTENDCERRAE